MTSDLKRIIVTLARNKVMPRFGSVSESYLQKLLVDNEHQRKEALGETMLFFINY